MTTFDTVIINILLLIPNVYSLSKQSAHSYLKSKSTDDFSELYQRPIHNEIILSLDLNRQVEYFSKFAPAGGLFKTSPKKRFFKEILTKGPKKLSRRNNEFEKTRGRTR